MSKLLQQIPTHEIKMAPKAPKYKYCTKLVVCLALTLIVCGQIVAAGQGCPFEDSNCQDYCRQQGCQVGYCGHFAWIQCICRKCGQEWNQYDKVRYNPNEQVNQTELDSLGLNGTAPLILTNSTDSRQQQQQQQQQPEKRATLTTLLIPDLSDSSRLDLNDIPDENSEKFLDYLAKNHERLVEATNDQRQEQQQRELSADSLDASTSSNNNNNNNNNDEDDDEQSGDGEVIEIQISSNNNNNNNNGTTSNARQIGGSGDDGASEGDQQQQQQPTTTTTRPLSALGSLLRATLVGRSPDEISVGKTDDR